jgi:NADPH2:quinone reductase
MRMKSIRVREFGDPSVLKLEDVPDPKAGSGQVVVRIKAAGVNPVETYIRSGKYASKPQLPYTPGNDGAGIVEEVGEGVTNVKVGDRVYVAGCISGTYAELALCEAERVHPLPENVSFAQGAGVGVPYGTAYRAIFQRGYVRSNEVVLVHGATGGVGIAAVQFLVGMGCRVIGTGGSAEGRMMIEGMGAELALDHHDPTTAQKIMDFTEGKGVDVILEMLASVNLGKDLTMLAKHGRVCVIGSRGKVEIDPRDTMSREADVRGVFHGGAQGKEHAEMHAAIVAGLRSGVLKPLLDRELPLSEAAKAHEDVVARGSAGKIVLVP